MRGQAQVRRFGRRLAACLWLLACEPGGGTRPPADLPAAEVYEAPPDFSGTWIGEVESTSGTLKIQALGEGRFYGSYKVEGVNVRYVIALEQSMRPPEGAGEPVPTNRCTFTWQDGRGGRGTGWLLINRESSALTGAFGEGAGHTGGMWSFIRRE